MRRSFVVVLVCFLAALLAAPSAFAQTDRGTILGQVTDESGSALPGVTVSVRSPQLQVPEITTVTDQNGEYRITQLPIGTYSVEYTLSGFQTLKLEDVRLPN